MMTDDRCRQEEEEGEEEGGVDVKNECEDSFVVLEYLARVFSSCCNLYAVD